MFSLLAQASEVGITAAVVAIVTALVSGGISALTKRAMSASEGRITDKIGRLETDVKELGIDMKCIMLDHAELKARVQAHLEETRHGRSKG